MHATLTDAPAELRAWDHWTFLQEVIELVRRDRTTALDRLRERTAVLGVPAAGGEPHETLAAFYVWAVDRLLAAGLDDHRVRWHPLTGPTAPRAWYRPATLRAAVARTCVVASDLARPGEPAPAPLR